MTAPPIDVDATISTAEGPAMSNEHQELEPLHDEQKREVKSDENLNLLVEPSAKRKKVDKDNNVVKVPKTLSRQALYQRKKREKLYEARPVLLKRSLIGKEGVVYRKVGVTELDMDAVCDKSIIVFNEIVSHNVDTVMQLAQLASDRIRVFALQIKRGIVDEEILRMSIGRYIMPAGEKRDIILVFELGTRPQSPLIDESMASSGSFEDLLVQLYRCGDVTDILEINSG